MTPAERFLKTLTEFIIRFNTWSLIKALSLVGLLIYVAFAVIVVRQVGLMTRTVNDPLNWPLRLIAWVHLGMALGILCLAWVIL